MRLSLPADPQRVQVGLETYEAADVWNHLSLFLTPQRVANFYRVINHRTWHIIPVLENLYDLGNLSACLRSADGIGIQSVLIVNTHQRFKESNRVSRGADKWLFLDSFENSIACIQFLKEKGYKVVATALHSNSIPVEQWDWNQKTAVIFGNEHEGVSQETLNLADSCLMIPMNGFVESFNISVAFALTCYLGYYKARSQVDTEKFYLSENEKLYVLAHWAMKSLASAREILKNRLKPTTGSIP